MIKAIITDMDGTLLNRENKIDELTKKALMDLEKKGVKLILASGRSYTRLMKYAKELEMEKHGGWLLEVDGIAVYDLENDVRNKMRTMDKEELRELFDYLITCDSETMACFDDGLFDYIHPSLIPMKEQLRKEAGVPEDYPWTAGPWGWLQDMRDGYPKISYISSTDEIEGRINKLQIMNEPDKIQALFEDLVEKFGGRFEIFRTTARQLEVLPKGYSKGATLQRLMDANGWKKDEVAAFGDGENDVSMFEVVDYSFAMENAQDYVKEHASSLAGRNDRNGIVQALDELAAKGLLL